MHGLTLKDIRRLMYDVAVRTGVSQCPANMTSEVRRGASSGDGEHSSTKGNAAKSAVCRDSIRTRSG